MVRFQGAEDRGYVSVMGELIRWCKAARENYITITELQEGTQGQDVRKIIS